MDEVATVMLEVAAYYFGNYHGKGWTEWDLVKAARPRFAGHQQPKEPLWGYEDEADPRVMAKKIDAAAGHGITAFLFDWYWHNTGPFLDTPLEQGFLNAPNRNRLKFAVMWANHDWLNIFPAHPGMKAPLLRPGQVTDETFDRATGHVVRRYFSQPNYWKIDGKPYFSIYELMTLVKGLGGLEQTRAALERFRRQARNAGLPGIHINAVAWGIQPDGIARALGVDSVTSYCWIHHTPLVGFPAASYSEWAQAAEKEWGALQGRFGLPYYPNVSMGWDPSPRTDQAGPYRNEGYPYTSIATGNTPAEFRKALETAKAYVESQPGSTQVITLNAWNEWTEGSYLEPDRRYKMEYLEAVRAVFT